MLVELVKHKGYANAAVLAAIRRTEAAALDPDLRKLLHHIITSDRYWLSLFLQLPFDLDKERRVPETLDELIARFQDTHAQELNWITEISEQDLDRSLTTPYFPDSIFSVAQAIMQVCMHSQAHRAQCATRLRALGGAAPMTDFIVWLKERPAPQWL